MKQSRFAFKYRFICVLWGERFLNYTVDYLISSLLAPGNLPIFEGDENAVMEFFLPAEEARELETRVLYQELKRYVKTRLHIIPDAKEFENRHLKMSNCHMQAISSRVDDKETLCFLSPDCLVSDGSIRNGVERIEQGYRAVMTVGLRVSEGTFSGDWHAARSGNGAVALSGRELAKLALASLHTVTKELVIGAEPFSAFPSNLFWRMPDGKSLLAKCFHQHPLLVRPKYPVSIGDTIDGDFVMKSLRDTRDVYVSPDSDEILVLSVESSEFSHGTVEKFDRQSMREFALRHANKFHRFIVRKSIFIHANEIAKQTRESAEREADRVLEFALGPRSPIELYAHGKEKFRLNKIRYKNKLWRIFYNPAQKIFRFLPLHYRVMIRELLNIS